MSGALAAARREAEELLGALAGCYRSPVERDLINAVAALLAALPAEGESAPYCSDCGGLGWCSAGDEQIGCVRCNGTGEAPAPQPAPTHIRHIAENCTDGSGGALCDRCFREIINSDIRPVKLSPEVEAAALTAYCDVCESDRRVSCHSTTTGEVALYPHPERVVAARAAKGGE